MALPNIWLLSGATVIFYVLFKLNAHSILYREINSGVKSLPGLSSRNFLMGNMSELLFGDQVAKHAECVARYGPTFKFKALLGDNWLFTVDVKALSHILKRDTVLWEKPIRMTWNLQRLLVPGIVNVISDTHRRQRKMLNPAFAPAEVKRFTPLFLDKAAKLRDAWSAEIQRNGDQPTRIDVLSWMSKATLDIVGAAGFGYEFNSLTEEPGKVNELHEAFKTLFQVGTSPSLIRNLRGLIPPLRLVPLDRDAEIEKARETMQRIGKKLLSERESLDSHDGKTGTREKDILSLLVHANASGKADQRIPEEQILAQIPSFITAGHETTSTATTWTLFKLAKNSQIQTRLREELFSVATQTPTVDQLNSLTYLDSVVRESMRLRSPIPVTARLAVKDDVIPLQTPTMDKFGNLHHEIRVLKGQTVVIPLAMVNQLPSIWGEDAGIFDPDRWNSPPEAAMGVPGIWGNLMSFFGGPRACIGFRFSLLELKALLFVLLRAFEFKLAVPTEDVSQMAEFVTRPVLRTDPRKLNQLPHIVQPLVL